MEDTKAAPYCYICHEFRQRHTTEGLELYEGKYLCPVCREAMQIIAEFNKRLERRPEQ